MSNRHEKFKKYWESLGKPALEWKHISNNDLAFVRFSEGPAWADINDYRIAGDPHWELRKEWVDSDFALPIERFIPSDEYGDDRWTLIRNTPRWDPEKKYRKAEPAKFDWIAHIPGNPMPVAESTVIEVQLADGDSLEGKAECFDWEAIYDNPGREITQYRIMVKGYISDAKASDRPIYDVEFAEPEVPFPVDELGVNHPMYAIFMDAIEQATGGKGQRHGGARIPFLEQRWHRISQSTGFRSLVYQMCKKAEEACDKDEYEAFERELLGALVYGAMSLIHVRKHGFTKEVKADE